MQANEAQINKFVKLLEQKKLKQARTYIAKIDAQDPDPIYQQIVNKALFKCLVTKKSTPLGMVTSLYIYKEMLIKCLFDYLECQSFDQKIHKFLYETCQYNFTAPVEDRGKLYFKEKMNLQANQQNQIYGNTIVTLSLEIVQTMANWYPIDYFSQKSSRYAQYYKKLTQNKVKFPKLQEHQFIKPDEKKKFNAGYDLFIKKMEMLDEDAPQQAKNDKNNKQQSKPVITQQTTPKINKEPAKNLQDNNTKKIDSKIDQGFIKTKTDDIKSKIISENKNQLQNLKQKAKAPIKNEQIKLTAIKEASPKKQQDIEDNQSLNKRQISKITAKGTESGFQKLLMPNQAQKQKKYTQKQKIQALISNPIKQMPKQPIKKIEQSVVKIETGSTLKQVIKQKSALQKNDEAMFILQQKNQQKPTKIKEEVKNIINNKNEQKQIKPQVKPNESARLQDKNLQSPNKSPDKKTQQIKKNQVIKNAGDTSLNLQIKNRVQRKHQQPTQKGNKELKNQTTFTKEQNKKSQIQRIHHQKNNLIYQIQNKYNNHKGMRRTQQNFYHKDQFIIQSRNIMTLNKNIGRTQKKAEQPQYVHGRHNSQPKTEKKASINTFDLNFARKNINIGQISKPIMNQTLSQLRNFKNKQKITNHTSETVYNQPILQLLDHNSIKADIIPFIPEYFLPLNNSMNLLLLESLKVGTNSQKSTPFLKYQQIEARLIKSQRFTYILSLYNKGYYQIQVIYSQSLHQKYANQLSSQIHIKAPRHQKNAQLTWIINPHEFVDIPFEFFINDPNFKFLDFVLKINNKIEILNLPITLLDQGFIQKFIDFQQISSFLRTYGKILKSSPVTLQSDFGADSVILPKIFNLNANKQSKLLGNLTYSIELRPKNLAIITIFVKKILQTKVQIYALFDSRNQQNEDFAKVLLQLFCFLLSASKI